MKRCYNRLHIISLFIITIYRYTNGCFICKDKTLFDGNASLAIPGAFGKFVPDCGSLQWSLLYGSFSSQVTDEVCDVVQTNFGPLCGCPSQETPCRLCGNASIPENFTALSVDISNKKLFNLSFTALPFQPSCQLLDGHAQSLYNESKRCFDLQESFGGHCGCATQPMEDETRPRCNLCPDGGNYTNRGKNLTELFRLISTEGTEISKTTCGSFEDTHFENDYLCDKKELLQYVKGTCGCPEQSMCKLCPDGGSYRNKNKDVTNLLLSILPEGTNIWKTTCGSLEDTLVEGTDFCNIGIIRLLQGPCGCSKMEAGLCNDWCPKMDKFEPNISLIFLGEMLERPLLRSCGSLMYYFSGLEEDDEECKVGPTYSYLCGCNDGLANYLGADSKLQKRILAWLPRVMAFLSLIGSSLIVRDVFKSAEKRKSMLHQLVCGISMFDICTSISLMFSTLPMPKFYMEKIPTGLYGAMGNDQTCTAQGFFVQLGFTSAFYNMMLSVYYLCVIRFGMRESQLRKYRFWFHIPVLVVGFGLAFGGIPFYENNSFWCHFLPKVGNFRVGNFRFTSDANTTVITLFTFVPMVVVICIGAINMILIYFHVRKQDQAANRWRIEARANQTGDGTEQGRTGDDSCIKKVKDIPRKILETIRSGAGRDMPRMTDAVFWQATYYMGAFFLTWPIYFIVNYLAYQLFEIYWVWVVVAILWPLQGFLNCIVYFRKRISAWRRAGQTKREEKKKKDDKTTTKGTEVPSTYAVNSSG